MEQCRRSSANMNGTQLTQRCKHQGGVTVTIKRQLQDQTRDLLVGLGGSQTEVAESLGSSGVLATPKDPEDCAVAVYLRATLGTEQRVKSLAIKCNCVMIFLDGPRRFHWRNVVKVELPEPVCQFILAFDQGAYPNLVRGSGPLPRHSESSTAT